MDTLNEQERARLLRQDERISPREIEIIKYRDNRTALLVKLVTGEVLEGAIRWYDDRAMRLVQSDRTEVTVYLQAIAYYRTRP
jgi:sRNA-binding regulator protein Hfq